MKKPITRKQLERELSLLAVVRGVPFSRDDFANFHLASAGYTLREVRKAIAWIAPQYESIFVAGCFADEFFDVVDEVCRGEYRHQ